MEPGNLDSRARCGSLINKLINCAAARGFNSFYQLRVSSRLQFINSPSCVRLSPPHSCERTTAQHGTPAAPRRPLCFTGELYDPDRRGDIEMCLDPARNSSRFAFIARDTGPICEPRLLQRAPCRSAAARAAGISIHICYGQSCCV